MRGEPFLYVVEHWRYLPMKKFNLSGRRQLKIEPLIANRSEKIIIYSFATYSMLESATDYMVCFAQNLLG